MLPKEAHRRVIRCAPTLLTGANITRSPWRSLVECKLWHPTYTPRTFPSMALWIRVARNRIPARASCGLRRSTRPRGTKICNQLLGRLGIGVVRVVMKKFLQLPDCLIVPSGRCQTLAEQIFSIHSCSLPHLDGGSRFGTSLFVIALAQVCHTKFVMSEPALRLKRYSMLQSRLGSDVIALLHMKPAHVPQRTGILGINRKCLLQEGLRFLIIFRLQIKLTQAIVHVGIARSQLVCRFQVLLRLVIFSRAHGVDSRLCLLLRLWRQHNSLCIPFIREIAGHPLHRDRNFSRSMVRCDIRLCPRIFVSRHGNDNRVSGIRQLNESHHAVSTRILMPSRNFARSKNRHYPAGRYGSSVVPREIND